MSRESSPSRVIAVGLKSWETFSQQAIQGFLRCARELGGFQFRDVPLHDTDCVLRCMKQFERTRPAGAILSLNATDFADMEQRFPASLPVVNIGADRVYNFPYVCADDPAIVQMAVAHLRDCGYAQLAWLGWRDSSGSARREQHCRSVVKSLASFNVQWADADDPPDAHIDRGLDAWLRSLRKPVGIVAWNGYIASRALRLCQQHELSVPRDVGIVSLVDEQVCLLSDPAISALDVNGEAIGYRAMKLLAACIDGRAVRSPVLISPAGVIARESTGCITNQNDEIEAATEYIDKNACAGISVEHVVKSVTSMGRTRFFTAFRERIGCSPAEYIRQAKIKRAKELLTESQLTVTRIAGLCGFGSLTQFGDTFKREVNATPLAYRRTHSQRRLKNDSTRDTSRKR